MDKSFKKLSSAHASTIVEGLSEIDSFLSEDIDPADLPIMFDAVTSLFYIDAFDRPDLREAIQNARQTMAKMGRAAIPLVLEKIVESDIKAELNFGRACGLMDASAISPLTDVIRNSSESAQVAFALYALGKIQSPEVVNALPHVLEKVNSPQKECEDTAVRALGKLCENMRPEDVSVEMSEAMFHALASKLSHSKDVIRSKAIRNLGKLIRYGFASDVQKNDIMSKVKQVMGLDEDRQLDPAFLVRREAQEILDAA